MAPLSRGYPVLRDGCLCEVRSGVCSCWHEVLCVVIASFYDGLPTQCFCFGGQAIFRNVGRENAWLPLRRFLAATAELDQVRALRVADW